MKFSVVVPTYNRAFYLRELLDRMVNQTYKNFEVLICDDGSVDETADIVKEYCESLNIRYFFSPNWGGPAKPRNTGIREAKGEWICFLDSDDLWTHNKLAEVSRVLSDEVDIVYHLFYTNYSNKIVIGNYRKSWFYSYFEDLLINGNKIVNSAITVRRSLLVKIDGLSENRNLIAVEDYDLIIRLAYGGAKFLLLNKVLGQYRINESNISSDVLKQVDKVSYLLKQYESFVKPSIRNKMSALVAYLRGSAKIEHSKVEGRKLFFFSLKYGSLQIKVKSFYKLSMSFLK